MSLIGGGMLDDITKPLLSRADGQHSIFGDCNDINDVVTGAPDMGSFQESVYDMTEPAFDIAEPAIDMAEAEQGIAMLEQTVLGGVQFIKENIKNLGSIALGADASSDNTGFDGSERTAGGAAGFIERQAQAEIAKRKQTANRYLNPSNILKIPELFGGGREAEEPDFGPSFG